MRLRPLIRKTLHAYIVVLLAFGWSAANAEESVVPPAPLLPAATPIVSDSAQLEKDLQSLPWSQFRAVIQAVPNLKAEVDAYGAFGWQYVQARYQTYRWRKSIDKLDVEQQGELARLIAKAKAGKLPVRSSERAS